MSAVKKRKRPAGKKKTLKKRRIPVKYWITAGLASGVVLAAGISFLMYRNALETEEQSLERIARMQPATLRIVELRICLPEPGKDNPTWITRMIRAESSDPTTIGRAVAERWASEVSVIAGKAGRISVPVDHFFIDDHRVAYVDFSPAFISSFDLGTAAESELRGSLEKTMKTNIPQIRGLFVMSGGAPLESWGGHLAIGS